MTPRGWVQYSGVMCVAVVASTAVVAASFPAWRFDSTELEMMALKMFENGILDVIISTNCFLVFVVSFLCLWLFWSLALVSARHPLRIP